MREFNITGVCVPKLHYMVNINEKLLQIEKIIEKNKYFTINRARQFGKTTTFSLISKRFEGKYLVIRISFEGLGDKAFESDKDFCLTFIDLIHTRLKLHKVPENLANEWKSNDEKVDRFELLSKKITQLVQKSGKEIILLIDEVDKSSNNQLFLHFLGMLRNKYLDSIEGYDSTFKSVILAGVYDIKNLKLKLSFNEEKKFNSPWNIASDFDVDMSFNPKEIATMLIDYEKENKTDMDIEQISQEIYKFTSGYPFLVSKLCKIIDENLNKNWSLEGVVEAVKQLLKDNNTLFDDLIKNIENNKELWKFISNMLVEGIEYSFVQTDPIVSLGMMFGIFGEKSNRVKIHNRIFEMLIYNHMSMAKEREDKKLKKFEMSQFIESNGKLNIIRVMDKFQELMRSEYRHEDEAFIEREGRLVFLAFIKPIINGIGNYFVEPETRTNKRMDIVVTYNKETFIIELKIWRGQKNENSAIQQLADYMDILLEKKGYLIIFNFNKNKEYSKQWISHVDKEIYTIIV